MKKTAPVTPRKPEFFPIVIDPAICNGCNRCVEACPIDVFAPNPEPGKPPLVLFPDVCWQDGSCVAICPQKGALRWVRQANQRVHCRRKATGEDFFI